ncbi:hypothetical protein J2810_003257 [Chryseobacterium rhizosphaerae]|nr:hypothetical protein [Chryseobacterium rhizosphaerae]
MVENNNSKNQTTVTITIEDIYAYRKMIISN